MKPLTKYLFFLGWFHFFYNVTAWDFTLPQANKPSYWVRQLGSRVELKKDLVENPRDPNRFARLAEAMLDIGNLDKAGYYLNAGWRKGTPSAYLSLISGKYHQMQGNSYQAASHLFRALVLSRQEEPRYFHEYCQFLFQQENYDKALHWTKLGLHLHSNDFILRYMLALVYIKLEHLKNAELALHEALQLEPQNTFALYNMSFFHALTKNTDGTLYYLRRAAFCGYRQIEYINTAPVFDLIREHPQALLIFEQIAKNQLRYRLSTSFNKI